MSSEPKCAVLACSVCVGGGGTYRCKTKLFLEFGQRMTWKHKHAHSTPSCMAAKYSKTNLITSLKEFTDTSLMLDKNPWRLPEKYLFTPLTKKRKSVLIVIILTEHYSCTITYISTRQRSQLSVQNVCILLGMGLKHDSRDRGLCVHENIRTVR